MKIIALLAALMCVLAARAQDRLVSVNAFDLGYSGGLLFKHDSGKGSTGDSDRNYFSLNLNYAQKISAYPNMMVKGVGRIQRDDYDIKKGDDVTDSIWALSGGLLYNHDAEDIKNSLFAGAQIGFEWQTIDTGKKDETGLNFTLGVEAGKRWHLGDYAMTNISYAPSIELLYRRYGGDIRDEFYTSGHEIKLNFLKFDVMF